MKKSLVVACLLSVCALSSFAQSPAQTAGAKLVAEHDAAYAKAHPATTGKATMPKVSTTKASKPMTKHSTKRHTPTMVKKPAKPVAKKAPAP